MSSRAIDYGEIEKWTGLTGIKTGLIEQKHKKAMGPASWLFHFLVARQTDKEGRVLFGHTITYRWISQQTGMPARSMERWMARLRKSGYVKPNRTPFGLQPVILNQKKFGEDYGNGKPQPKPVRGVSRQERNQAAIDGAVELFHGVQRKPD